MPRIILALHNITLSILTKGPTSILQSPHVHRGQRELMVLITSQERVLKQHSFMACTSEKNESVNIYLPPGQAVQESILVAIRESEQNNNRTVAALQISTDRVKRYPEAVSKS